MHWLTIGQYTGGLSTDKCVHIGWCIGRLSVDISVDYRSTVGRLSTDISVDMSTEATYSTRDPPALQIQNWKKKFIFFHSIEKQTHQNVVRTAVTHLALPCVPHFDVVCDLLLNRPTALLFVFSLIILSIIDDFKSNLCNSKPVLCVLWYYKDLNGELSSCW